MQETTSLGQICLQVHPHRAPKLDLAALRQACESIARRTEGVRGIGFTEGDDEGPYLNIVFAAEWPVQAWASLRTSLLDSGPFGDSLKRACLCMCTGQNGWNDHRLLYHYDPGVPLDLADD